MKKVIRIFVSVFVFLNLCMSFAQFAHSASWSIDSSHTSVAFKIRHLGVSWVRGEFRSFNGQVEYDPKKISKTKVSVSIDAKSVDTRNERRDAHLRNSDFFDVEKHPKIEIIHSSNNEYLFKKIQNIIALVSNDLIDTDIPQFKKNEIDLIVKFILKFNNE